MKIVQRRSKKKPVIITLLVAILIAGAAAGWYFFLRPSTQEAAAPSQNQSPQQPDTNPAPIILTARDESLGSGFSIEYPKGWVAVHSSASNPTSTTEAQKDETMLTSPSGAIQVVLEVQTNTQIGGLCTPDYLELKYLQTDTTPKFADGRFAGYVVYFPDFNLYQYHVGLQKNTEAIRGVTIESNTDCNFMFSEFIDRESSITGVGLTRTRLYIRFPELQTGNDLKSGITEVQVAEKLSGAEFEQAKEIIRSVSTDR